MSRPPTIHLEGMGVVGSLLAHRLTHYGVSFTWSDTEDPFSAWQASTGSIYPSSEANTARALGLWRPMLRTIRPLRRQTEDARWCYTSKNPPEGGKVKAIAHAGPVTISDGTSLQVNVQAMVADARQRYAQVRSEAPTRRQQLIVTHGSANAKHFTWGWSALVRLEFEDELLRFLVDDTLRPAVYMRQHYDVAYIYPHPGDDWYWGGTAVRVQKTPAERTDTVDLYRAWKQKVEDRTDGQVVVVGAKKGSIGQGWRPKPRDEDTGWAWQTDDGAIQVRPLGGSGLQHFPLVAEAVERLLGLS